MNIWEDIKREVQSGNILTRLIVVNVGVFMVLNLIQIVLFLMVADRSVSGQNMSMMLEWVMLPANTGDLLRHPWTLITHMFSHFAFFHLLFNMLWLYWFGQILIEFIGARKIWPLYILGGLSGAFLLIIAYHIFPGLQSQLPLVRALGASAAVLAIVVAAATLVPEYTVILILIGPVKIKWIAAFLIVLDLISIPEMNTGGHIAHLGGALFGFIYIRQLQVGKDLGAPIQKLSDYMLSLIQPRQKPKVVFKKVKADVRKGTPPTPANKQERIDHILDKIAQSGYDSLSKEEKEFLFRFSKEE